MAPQTRNQFPKVVIEKDSDSEPSSSEEEEEDQEEEDEEEEEVVESEIRERKEEALDEKKKGKAPITISLKKVCKVKAFTYPRALIGF
jgi:DNA damage-binding protein 2